MCVVPAENGNLKRNLREKKYAGQKCLVIVLETGTKPITTINNTRVDKKMLIILFHFMKKMLNIPFHTIS